MASFEQEFKILRIFITVSILHCFVLVFVHGHSKYVPDTPEVCDTMVPHHKRESQTSESPFKVIVYAEKVLPGKTISVSLVSDEVIGRRQCRSGKRRHNCRDHDSKTGFKGFYVQARDSRENKPIGKFKPKEDLSVKVHNCGQGTDNAAFHGVKGHKTNVTVEWTAPDDFTGKVIFTTTFVKKYHKFWTQVKSEPVSVRVPYSKVQL